jgi:hypothetical protein
MRMHRIISSVPFLLALFAAGAAAQQVAPQPQPQPAPAPAPAAAPQGGAQGSTTTVQQPPRPVSPQELVAQGNVILQRGSATSQSVRKMLDNARKEADIIKITCLDDKLTRIDVNLRTAESRLDALKKAVDPDRRTHEFTVLTVVGQKLEVLDQEAHQCVGQAMYETGATKVVTEIDTGMLPFEEDPSNPPAILPPSLPAVPPAASLLR